MSHDKKEILCTIGPSSLNEWTINRLQSLGVSLFRINLSHTSLEDLPVFINTITENSDVPICLDTEGAQIRTSDFRTGSIIVKDYSKINIVKNITEGDRKDIILYPDTVWDQLKVDDLLTIDFDSVLAKVISKEKTTIKIRILNGGEIMPNKAVSSGNRILLPPLTKKDKQAIQICSQLQIKYYALSFVHQASDIDELKRYVPKDSIILSKIVSSAFSRSFLNKFGYSSASLFSIWLLTIFRVYHSFLFFSSFFFITFLNKFANGNDFPESTEPYFFNTSFFCFSSSALIDKDTFLCSLESSIIITSKEFPFAKREGLASSLLVAI